MESVYQTSRELIDRYRRQIRGKTPPEDFWDAVIISAGDEAQKSWFEMQLKQKSDRGHLPRGVDFRVFSDPDGVRVGDGGAALNIFDRIRDEMTGKKILLIHAGGYSKRLPSHSCTGKIFSPVPVLGGPNFDMLDLKLCIYEPFRKLMRPGDVFCTASDDIESYDFSREDQDNILRQISGLKDEPFLISLSHPSTLKIGKGHGVFKFPVETAFDWEKSVLSTTCEKVFQKPSIDTMRKEGLINRHPQTGEEFVFTDSAFWINAELVQLLLRFYDENKPISAETSMYSDFMGCQGGVGRDEGNIEDCVIKRKIYALMKDVPLYNVVLPRSKFYHIGTLSEYVDAFCSDPRLAHEMNFSRVIDLTCDDENIDLGEAVIMASEIRKSSPDSSLIFSNRSVIEYSVIRVGRELIIEDGAIVSNCFVGEKVSRLSGNRVYHTVPIRENGQIRFVTVSFHFEDDLKKMYSNSEGLLQPAFMNNNNFEKRPEVCLWEAKLFPSASSMEEAFYATSELLHNDDGGTTLTTSKRMFYSMDDLIRLKDRNAILEYRKKF